MPNIKEVVRTTITLILNSQATKITIKATVTVSKIIIRIIMVEARVVNLKIISTRCNLVNMVEDINIISKTKINMENLVMGALRNRLANL